MSSKLKVLMAALTGCVLVGTQAAAEPAPCTTCDSPKQLTIREQIKADRDKYDRENVKTSARPWDGLNLGQAKIEKKTSVPQ